MPTAPAAATSTSTPSPTPVPSPTQSVEQFIYPYTIDGLRHHYFQGGDVAILSTLETTDIYTRYLISYPSDGLTITGILQIPIEGHPPYPVIVMNHGYFNRSDYISGDGSDRAAEYLNKHGYLTLAPDYRSWGGSDVGPSLYYSGLAIDVINLLNAVPSIPQADFNRVGMWGHSMGGGVTLKVLEVDARVRAAVLYSTVSADETDLLERWGLGCIGDIAAGEQQLGCNSSDIVPLDLPSGLIQAYYESSMDADLLRQVSPLYHLDLVSAPVQIAYGTADGKVLSGTPPEWSKKLYQAFKDVGKSAQLFGYDGETHSFNGDAWLAFMERSSRFFDQYVKSAP
jgi:dipeptidyl aminopeptidase/acylaminoacyl peptidase